MDQSTQAVDPVILIFLFLVFSIGAIAPVVWCVWGAKRAESERRAAAEAEIASNSLSQDTGTGVIVGSVGVSRVGDMSTVTPERKVAG